MAANATGSAVLKSIKDRNIWLINATILSVGCAYGVAISLFAMFLDGRGYDETDIGKLAMYFAAGLVAFSLPMDKLIQRFSARVVLISAIAIYAATVAVFPFVVNSFATAAIVRVIDGAASVGIWISCETIVLSRAERHQKAFVTTLYAVSIAVGYMVGPGLSKLFVYLWPMEYAFVAAGVISLATAIGVALTLDPDVEHEERSPSGNLARQTPIGSLIWRIKTSCLGTFAYGYFQVSVVLFLPLYLIKSKGITEEQTILIPGFFALGMLLFTNLAGRLGDRFGHLLLMRVLGTIGTFTVLGFVFLHEYWQMCVMVALAGATLAAISPISLALQGVIIEPPDYSRSNAVYNAFYASGMLLGPFVSSHLASAYGGATMLYHLSAMWACFVVFTVVFWRDDPAVQRAELEAAGE